MMKARPERYDSETVREVAEALLAKGQRWAKERQWSAWDEAKARMALITALENQNDGYGLARALEIAGACQPDEALVPILAEAGSLRSDIAEERERRWVKENKTQPPEIPYGSRVRFKNSGRWAEGYLAGDDPELGRSLIQEPRDWEAKDRETKSYWCIPWEEVKAL